MSAKEFPIQTTMTAVKMVIQPGGLREMHWHPHADEWQYYLKGRSRIRVFGSHGRWKTDEFGPGQVAFIKQGDGHYVEQLGDEPTEILILFNTPSSRKSRFPTGSAATPCRSWRLTSPASRAR